MKNVLLNVMNKAVDGLKEWTDPAYEGNPYEPHMTYAKPFSIKKLFGFRKRMMWRI